MTKSHWIWYGSYLGWSHLLLCFFLLFYMFFKICKFVYMCLRLDECSYCVVGLSVLDCSTERRKSESLSMTTLSSDINKFVGLSICLLSDSISSSRSRSCLQHLSRTCSVVSGTLQVLQRGLGDFLIKCKNQLQLVHLLVLALDRRTPLRRGKNLCPFGMVLLVVRNFAMYVWVMEFLCIALTLFMTL